MNNNPFTSVPNNNNDVCLNLTLRISQIKDEPVNDYHQLITLGDRDYGISIFCSPAKPPLDNQTITLQNDAENVILPSQSSKNVVLRPVAKSLLRYYKKGLVTMCRFSFAYNFDGNDVIYASVELLKDNVAPCGRMYRVSLGDPDKLYTCELSNGGTVELTAREIEHLYQNNRERYIARIKQERINQA